MNSCISTHYVIFWGSFHLDRTSSHGKKKKSEVLSVEDFIQFIAVSLFYEVSGPDGIHPNVEKNETTENPRYSHTNIPNR